MASAKAKARDREYKIKPAHHTGVCRFGGIHFGRMLIFLRAHDGENTCGLALI